MVKKFCFTKTTLNRMHTKYGYYRQRTMDLTFTIRPKKIPRKFAVDATFLWNKNIIYAHDYHRMWKNFYLVSIWKLSVRIFHLPWIKIFLHLVVQGINISIKTQKLSFFLCVFLKCNIYSYGSLPSFSVSNTTREGYRSI